MACAGCATGADGKAAGCGSNGGCSSGGCNKLDVHDWLAGVPLPSGQPLFDGVEVRFKGTRKAFYRNATGLQLGTGDVVTVEASPGYDVGVVSLSGELVRAQMARKGAGADTFELRKVLRKSTQEEIDRWHQARLREEQTMLEARAMAREARLDMKVTDAEFQGDGTKVIIYYTAEERVDFRSVLHRMADRFKARVEMKQIGARQEAGRIGGIGSCGRELCCSTWLTDFRSVSTSAARYQQLALNPQKLTGQCGKLKCCLNYELDMYIEAIKSYPSQNAKLKTQQGTGTHIKTDIFAGRMWYGFKKPGEGFVMAGFPVDAVRDIIAQNKQGIEPEVDLHMAEEEPQAEKAPDYENVVGQDDLTRFDSKMKSGKRRRGKERRGPASGKEAQGAPKPQRTSSSRSPGEGAAPGEGQAQGQRPGGGRRRRRRPGDRPSGAGAPPSPPAA